MSFRVKRGPTMYNKRSGGWASSSPERTRGEVKGGGVCPTPGGWRAAGALEVLQGRRKCGFTALGASFQQVTTRTVPTPFSLRRAQRGLRGAWTNVTPR